MSNAWPTRRFRAIGPNDLLNLPQLRRFSYDERLAMRAVASVLPFRANEYVVDELIDWDRAPDDPMFQLTFPQRGMLASDDVEYLVDLLRNGASNRALRDAARPIQLRLNPQPGGQLAYNVPDADGKPLSGVQHKYKETVLLFPSPGQTCHSYCSYCFRWAQFVGIDGLKFASDEPDNLARYVREHPEITDVLFTGGDPLVMKTSVLRRYVEPMLSIEHVQNVRIGTKSLAFWPQRFVTDADADDLLRLFEEITGAGKQIALMGHYSHWRELSTPIAEAAMRRCTAAGAIIRTQAPLIRNVNDDPQAWARMWRQQLRLGAVPYYMFVERDTGANNYFKVPLARALAIYRNACGQVSGLGRTARGPTMSCSPGKILVDGVAEVAGQKVFVLKMIQARDAAWLHRPFFARFDPEACWMDDLVPAFDEKEFYFEPEYRELIASGRLRPASTQDETRPPLYRVAFFPQHETRPTASQATSSPRIGAKVLSGS